MQQATAGIVFEHDAVVAGCPDLGQPPHRVVGEVGDAPVALGQPVKQATRAVVVGQGLVGAAVVGGPDAVLGIVGIGVGYLRRGGAQGLAQVVAGIGMLLNRDSPLRSIAIHLPRPMLGKRVQILLPQQEHHRSSHHGNILRKILLAISTNQIH